MKKNVLIPIASGVEEIEAVTAIDVLRRGDLWVRVCSIEERQITCAHGVKILADSNFMDETIEDYDAIVLPGGSKAADAFYSYAPLITALKTFQKQNKLIGAICASPAIVLAQHGFLDHIKATAYPSLKDYIKNYSSETVVYNDNIVTSQGPGTAIDFALKILEILAGKEKALTVAKAILRDW